MTKLAWVCDECNWLTVSDSKEHHKMDMCRCENPGGVDLEEYHLRILGRVRILMKLSDNEKWKIKEE